MISRRKKSLLKLDTGFWWAGLLASALFVLWSANRVIAAPEATPGLVAHEWGTFTAIAGKDGHAVQWAPLIDPAELPAFVEHLSSATFKIGLRGTIRMETPVLYFYSPREVNLSVNVAFAKGLITEWYPRAGRVEPRRVGPDTDLNHIQSAGSITWSDIAVSASLNAKYPRDAGENRYYAARETSSTPLRVKTTAGDQTEKFLFYRGVSATPLPVAAKQVRDGGLVVKSLNGTSIPAAILFERRGERIGYRVEQVVADEMVLDSPSWSGSLESLYTELEAILVNQGLYTDEAHAMVETWKDSWFEEGSRLIYIVPRSYIDEVLPLTIHPAPETTVRIFVGRMEIVTPATARAVRAAVAVNDAAVLNKYGRFLEPILRIANER
jgi:hypothetical protein